MWYIIEYSEMPLKLLLGFKMVIMAKRRFWRVGVTLKGSASYFKDSTRGEGEGGGWYTMEGFHRPPSFPLKRLLSVQMFISQIFSLAILWQQLAFYFEAFEKSKWVPAWTSSSIIFSAFNSRGLHLRWGHSCVCVLPQIFGHILFKWMWGERMLWKSR